MQNGTKHDASGLKATGMIVPVAMAGTPRRPWRLNWRMLAADAAYVLERAGQGLFRIEGNGRHGIPSKMRINLWHPMALPVCCIFLAALPFLTLWAAIVPVLRWHELRAAMRHNTEMLRNRS